MKVRDLATLSPARWEFFCPACGRGHTAPKKEALKDGAGFTLSGTPDAPTLDRPIKVKGDPVFGIPACTVTLRDGVLTYGRECTHALAGRTAPLPDFPTKGAKTPAAPPLPPTRELPPASNDAEPGARVRVVQTHPPQWSIWCVACGREHVFDARWEFDGDLEEPTLKGSILAHPYPPRGWKRCHSRVQKGRITYHSDSEHPLAGRTLHLPAHPHGQPEPIPEIPPEERRMVKEIPAKLRHPVTGEWVDGKVKFGRTRPARLHPDRLRERARMGLAPEQLPGAVRLKDFVRKEKLEAIPDVANNSAAAMASLRDIYLNDTLGCCVIAGGYHADGIWTGNADGGSPFVATDDQITADYSAVGGYVKGDSSTDNGCDEDTALNYWKSKGFADGDTILTWVEVDGSDWDEFCLAIHLFECALGTLECPDSYVDPFPVDGTVWDVGAPNPDNGHAILFWGYDRTKEEAPVDTWAVFPLMTRAAIAALCIPGAGGGIYLALTHAMIARGQTKAPNGVDWDALLAAIEAAGAPAPAPTPPASATIPSPPPAAPEEETPGPELAPRPTPGSRERAAPLDPLLPDPSPPQRSPASPPGSPPTLFAVQTWLHMALTAWPKDTLTKNEALSLTTGMLAKHWPKKPQANLHPTARSQPVPIPPRQNQPAQNRAGQIPIPKPAARSQPVKSSRQPAPRNPLTAVSPTTSAGGPKGQSGPPRQIWPPRHLRPHPAGPVHVASPISASAAPDPSAPAAARLPGPPKP